ncbi:ExeM/NucH family extracellular endonuclease [Marinobacter lacisalsi]|uniref:ExeM/NucH family extracellular endonuclease n=1 Tax=Marinobacter lacisalsi TaxID=475979 RepID=A0ABV8QC14_9GAMM
MPGIIVALLLSIAATPLWAANCDEEHVPVSRIQGRGDASPMAGQQVRVQGIITVDLRHEGGFRGFYLQQALAEQDKDDATSEGLFIHTRARAGEPGDRVHVSGEVREHYGLTSLTGVSAVSICASPGLPAPLPLKTGATPPDSRESLEGMLVHTVNPLTVTDTWNLARYGELVLAPSLQWVPTQVMAPGPDAQRHQAQQERQRLILDDGHRRKHPRPVPYLTNGEGAPGNPLRVGDRVAPLAGVMDYRFGHWRLQPLSRPDIHHTNPRQLPPARNSLTNVRVVSLNLGNLFNGDGQGGGFPTDRGADSHQAYQQQLARLAHQIIATDPDIVAVSELENDGYGEASSLADLAGALGERWRFVDSGTHRHDDAIRNGLLYRGDRVQPQGPATLITGGAFEQWHRPALAQRFLAIGGNEPLTVMSVHLKSKSCRNAPAAQQDAGDGQGCFAAARTAASRQLAQWQPPETGKDNLVLLAGDFNAYAMETSIQAITDAGYTDLIADFHGLEQQTFRYHGRQGTLDYHFANKALRDRVVVSQIWSANAEEPRFWAYDADRGPRVSDTFVWRASDHNPVITDIRLQAPAD